jgi:hypothetical protein
MGYEKARTLQYPSPSTSHPTSSTPPASQIHPQQTASSDPPPLSFFRPGRDGEHGTHRRVLFERVWPLVFEILAREEGAGKERWDKPSDVSKDSVPIPSRRNIPRRASTKDLKGAIKPSGRYSIKFDTTNRIRVSGPRIKK